MIECKCDICGAVLSMSYHHHLGIDMTDTEGNSRSFWICNEKMFQYDLCPDCFDEIVQAIDGIKERKQNDATESADE